MGERVRPMALDPLTYGLWARDVLTPANQNLYGSHPFYLETLSAGSSHGVFMRNSNGMDIVLTVTSLSYRMIGGVIDLTIVTGPTPEAAIKQYHAVIGLPMMPPLWSLGFHQCRWGYANLSEVQGVVEQYAAHQIPLDTIWTDIDYMHNFLDFTFDPVRFPQDAVAAFVAELHAKGQHHVAIIDPGIHNVTGYAPYDLGLAQNVFIEKAKGIFIGRVWPGSTAFPDWFAPNAGYWWMTLIDGFLKAVPYDGIWIDMNEISNFCTGECDSQRSSKKKGNAFDPINPPYAIDNRGRNGENNQPLNTDTLDMDCKHGGNPLYSEYNVHNLFGHMEGIVTSAALESITGKRSLVLSRSTFAGSGHHVAHWLGDNEATFEAMRQSIAGVLTMGVLGVPLVGADVCGFSGNTTEELCARWMALGSFYPFVRNHNAFGQLPQEAYRWASVAAISRKTLGARYALLSYLYTQFYLAHRDGGAVALPLFYAFPSDVATHALDAQFLFGPALLVSPTLQAGVSSTLAYFPPEADWFDYWTLARLPSAGWVTLAAPLDSINLHLRSGQIVARQPGASRPWTPGAPLTAQSVRPMPYELVVVLNRKRAATGRLFLDDGLELGAGANSALVVFDCAATDEATIGSTALISTPAVAGSLDPVTAAATVTQITIVGLELDFAHAAEVDGTAWPLHYIKGVGVLSGLSLRLTKAFRITFQ